jgi:hypothetical protein
MNYYIFLLLSVSAQLLTDSGPMVCYPNNSWHTHLRRVVDIDFTSSLNTEDRDGVQFAIGYEMPSYIDRMTGEGDLR